MNDDANAVRTDRGRRAIAAHPDYRSGGLDFYSAATDTIADVLHALAREDACNREPFDLDRYLDSARATFEGDRADDENDELPAPTNVDEAIRTLEGDENQ